MPSEYKPNLGPIAITAATETINADGYAGKVMVINRAAGSTVTLPAATGTGATYEFILQVAVTSNTTVIKVANSTDVMVGNAIIAQDAGDTVVMFEAGATADTVTFNGTTTGGLAGARVLITDIAAGVFFVNVVSAATGTEATPFSATV